MARELCSVVCAQVEEEYMSCVEVVEVEVHSCSSSSSRACHLSQLSIVKRKKNKFICTFSFASVISAYTSCTIMYIIWRMKGKGTTCINTFLYTRYVPAESAFCVCELSVSVCVPLFF